MLTPLQESFCRAYDGFRRNYYRSLFEQGEVGELSSMEIIALGVINTLNRPTISQFANFMNISQSNATYKINNLIKKGYVERENSEDDRREYYLVLTPKYREYVKADRQIHLDVLDRFCASFSEEELVLIQRMFEAMGQLD